MNIIRIAILLAVAAAFSLPGAAMAFDNKLEASYYSASGDYTIPGVDADFSLSRYTLGYTRFFESIETDDSPYAMREFLQHPTRLFATYQGMSMEIEASAGKRKITQSDLELGGEYFLETGTGLGASIASSSKALEQTGSAKIEATGPVITIFVDQYVTETVLVGADYSSGTLEVEQSGSPSIDLDETMFHVRAEALINNFVYLEAEAGSGKEKPEMGEDVDLGNFSLTAGVFPNQQLGIYLNYMVDTRENTGTDETTTITMLSAEYFLDEAVGLNASVGTYKSKDDKDDSETDATMMGIGVTALF